MPATGEASEAVFRMLTPCMAATVVLSAASPACAWKLGEKLEYLLVLDTHHHATADCADLLLPIASFAETDGTFVNRKGQVQRIRPAVEPPGAVRPGWQIVGELAERMGAGAAPASATAVFANLAASVPAFRSLSYDAIGLAGQALPESAS